MDLIFSDTDFEEDLLKASQCGKRNCKEKNCLIINDCINDIEISLKFGKLKSLGRQILSEIIKHSTLCDAAICQIPWCQFLTSKIISFNVQTCDLYFEKIINQMILFYDKSILNKEFISLSDDYKFIKLNNNSWQYRYSEANFENNNSCPESNEFGWPYLIDADTHAIMPWPDANFKINESNINFGYLTLTASIANLGIYVQIKEDSCFEYCDIIKNLRNISHRNITELFWVCISRSIFVCSSFNSEQKYLNDVLDKELDGTLSMSYALNIIKQLLAAAQYLYGKNLLYLLWTAEHILLDDKKCAYLCNLNRLAPSIIEDNEDIDLYISMVPPYVLPPEAVAHENRILDEKTAIWGLGVLLYEMKVGNHLFFEYRHDSIDYQYEKIRNLDFKAIQSKLNSSNENYNNIVHGLFTGYEQRISMLKLESYLNGC